mmetsp:Transcript_113255/g.300913  ORF Transcript_113255/g.300913 Transcript_113255/m.300913 type:complete len:250 (+) Transcript_113255:174-923(+)
MAGEWHAAVVIGVRAGLVRAGLPCTARPTAALAEVAKDQEGANASTGDEEPAPACSDGVLRLPGREELLVLALQSACSRVRSGPAHDIGAHNLEFADNRAAPVRQRRRDGAQDRTVHLGILKDVARHLRRVALVQEARHRGLHAPLPGRREPSDTGPRQPLVARNEVNAAPPVAQRHDVLAAHPVLAGDDGGERRAQAGALPGRQCGCVQVRDHEVRMAELQGQTRLAMAGRDPTPKQDEQRHQSLRLC